MPSHLFHLLSSYIVAGRSDPCLSSLLFLSQYLLHKQSPYQSTPPSVYISNRILFFMLFLLYQFCLFAGKVLPPLNYDIAIMGVKFAHKASAVQLFARNHCCACTAKYVNDQITFVCKVLYIVAHKFYWKCRRMNICIFVFSLR